MELHQVDSSEMYSPNEQGEYVPKAGAQNFSVQGLMVVLATLDPEVTEVPQPAEEYALLLEVMMADWPGCLQIPCILLELQHGTACVEEGSHIKGFGACAGGRPRHSIPLLL